MKHSDMQKFSDKWWGRAESTGRRIFQLVPQEMLDNLSRHVIAKNGLEFEISICMEEISELATELILDNSVQNTAGEIADVFITLNHVTYGYNIQQQVHKNRTEKIKNPELLVGNNARIIALLELQKELLKHLNRKRDNMDAIIDKTGDAYTALARMVIGRNNLPLVRKAIYDKIDRTFRRER